MRVDLRGVRDARGGDAERADRPVEVGLLIGPTQRQKLAQRRLVDLHDADTRALQVDRLGPDRERDLVRRVGERDVVADEGPREDRHRAGEHALDRGVRERLGVGGPVDGHRLWTSDVAEEDRRAHTARAVGLHPAELGGDEAVHELGEVLHHVVALGLAVDEHIDAERLLQLDGALDLLAHRRGVRGLVDVAVSVRRTGFADLRGLRV